MWLTPGRASGRKTLPQYSSLRLLKTECHEEEVQSYRKLDYKPMILNNVDAFMNYVILTHIRLPSSLCISVVIHAPF